MLKGRNVLLGIFYVSNFQSKVSYRYFGVSLKNVCSGLCKNCRQYQDINMCDHITHAFLWRI